MKGLTVICFITMIELASGTTMTSPEARPRGGPRARRTPPGAPGARTLSFSLGWAQSGHVSAVVTRLEPETPA